jgi:periplasmic protein TonB
MKVVRQTSRSAGFGSAKMTQQKTRPSVTLEDRAALQTRQSHRLLLALVILIAAIGVLLVTDRDFWFGSNPLILDSDGTEQAAAPRSQAVPSPAKPTTPAPTAQKQVAAKSAVSKSVAPKSAAPKSTGPKSTSPVVTRTVLPPLNVEVVAGNAHRVVHPGSNASKVQITQPSAAPVNNAAEREPISPDAIRPEPSYPLLAQHMNVQGSVVLKAVIGADGIIQDLHILSGPAILAAAAQQAVREWHFKPMLRDGQPVETMAKIVVNFSIRVADNSEKTTLAESRATDRLIITR